MQELVAAVAAGAVLLGVLLLKEAYKSMLEPAIAAIAGLLPDRSHSEHTRNGIDDIKDSLEELDEKVDCAIERNDKTYRKLQHVDDRVTDLTDVVLTVHDDDIGDTEALADDLDHDLSPSRHVDGDD